MNNNIKFDKESTTCAIKPVVDTTSIFSGIDNNDFKIKELPQMQFFSDEDTSDELNTIKENYKLICQDSNNILQILLENIVTKSLMLYYLLFFVELKLKYYLIINSKLELEYIENCDHNLLKLIEISSGVDIRIKFSKLRYLLNQFKDKNGHCLNLIQYSNYKYNYIKKSRKIIFEYEMSTVEIKNMEEVILWLNSHI